MKALVQRVSRASVVVGDRRISAIEAGLLVLLGVAKDDREADATRLARKTAALRVFEDDTGKMNRSVVDTGGRVLVVSQFTLCGDTRKGNRPSFIDAAAPDAAAALYQHYCGAVAEAGVAIAQGQFAAHMAVELVNDGPVTIWLDTAVM